MTSAKTIRNLLISIIFLLPFHTLLVNSLNYFLHPSSTISFIISSWKEILFVLAATIAISSKETRKRLFASPDKIDYLILSYIALALLNGLIFWGLDFKILIWGIKYSISFFIIFLFCKKSIFTKEDLHKLIITAILAASLVLSFGFLQKFLPADFLLNFGYSDAYSTFAINQATAFCQKIPHSDTCRLQSTLSGPNQFAAYLLFILPIFLFYFLQKIADNKSSRNYFGLLGFTTFLGIFGLIFSYSRSAWIGFLGGLLFIISKKFSISRKKIGLFLATLIILLSPLLIFNNQIQTYCADYDSAANRPNFSNDSPLKRFSCQTLLRPSSLSEHIARTSEGITEIITNPLGKGLGTAGPASRIILGTQNEEIPESWYLQTGIEFGIPGLVLFLIIIWSVFSKLQKIDSPEAKALTFGLIAISIMAIKLHAWESADVSYSFWILTGAVLSQTKAKNNTQ